MKHFAVASFCSYGIEYDHTIIAESDFYGVSGHELMIESSLPPAKKSRRNCHFDSGWIKCFKDWGKVPKVNLLTISNNY